MLDKSPRLIFRCYKKSDLLYWIFSMAAWTQEWNKCLWMNKSGRSFVLISKIKLRSAAWFSKVQYSGFFANQVSDHRFGNSSRDPKGSTLECGSGSLWHLPGSQLFMVFYPEGAQLQTPKLYKANQSVIGEGSFQSTPDSKINVSRGANSGYFANTITCRDQGLHGYPPLSSVTGITGKKSLNQNILRWVRHFGMKQLPYTGKICATHPSQPLFQHSSLTRRKFKHRGW